VYSGGKFVLKETSYEEEEFAHLMQMLALTCALSATPPKSINTGKKVVPYKAFEGLIWGVKVLKPTGDDVDKVSYSFIQKLGLPMVVMRSQLTDLQWWSEFGSEYDLPKGICSPLFSQVRLRNDLVPGMAQALVDFDMRVSKNFTNKSRHWADIFLQSQISPDMSYMKYLYDYSCVKYFLNFGSTIVKDELRSKPNNKGEGEDHKNKIRRMDTGVYFQLPKENLDVFVASFYFGAEMEEVKVPDFVIDPVVIFNSCENNKQRTYATRSALGRKYVGQIQPGTIPFGSTKVAALPQEFSDAAMKAYGVLKITAPDDEKTFKPIDQKTLKAKVAEAKEEITNNSNIGTNDAYKIAEAIKKEAMLSDGEFQELVKSFNAIISLRDLNASVQ
jgi:hypothetical protein